AQSVQNSECDVVILSPDTVDVRKSGQKILHHFETVVAVPVRVLGVENLDIGAFDLSHERIETLVVDHRWQSAEHDDVSFAAELLGEVICCDFSHAGIIACNIEVLNSRFRERAVNNRY